MQTKALPGFREFYPAELALRTHIIRTWRTVAARYGFEEYDGPPLEPLELYTAKSGDEIVGQLYAFTDKGGREVALRPEMTPTLARMVAARANGLKKPIRWFAIPQLFRYERQQRGRLREHFQLNCDLIGEPGPLGDAEIIALAIDVMRAFGLGPGDVRVRLSDRRVLRALLLGAGVSEPQLPAAYQAVDKIERVPAPALTEQLAAAGVPAQPVDRAPPRRCGDPAARVRWQAIPRPDAKRQCERILNRVLGDLDLPEDPDQGGHRPAGLLAEDLADRGLIHTRRCVAGPVDAVSVAHGQVCHPVRPAWCPRRGGPRSACRRSRSS